MTEPARRQYPPVYEKIVPAALVVISIVVIALLLVTVAVALRLIPAAL
jgi:hypothetical protein